MYWALEGRHVQVQHTALIDKYVQVQLNALKDRHAKVQHRLLITDISKGSTVGQTRSEEACKTCLRQHRLLYYRHVYRTGQDAEGQTVLWKNY